jgi:hypothetical protein
MRQKCKDFSAEEIKAEATIKHTAQLEAEIEQAVYRMELHLGDSTPEQFTRAAEDWVRASEQLLQIAQRMNAEQASAMVEFTLAITLSSLIKLSQQTLLQA